MKRFRKAWPGVVAIATAALVMPLLADSPASAVGVSAGPAQISPTTGNSATPFTLNLPSGAACTGDSANGGYTITSYMVTGSTDVSALTFDPLGGPLPLATGANFRQPLYEVGSGSPFVAIQTANADTPGGPGVIIGVPQFDLSSAGFVPGDIPAGAYNVGIGCVKGGPSPTQFDKFWNTKITVTTNPSGGPAQVSFAEGAVPSAPVLNSVSAGNAQLTATFAAGGTSVPATTGFTVSATPQGGGAAVTQNGAGSPITVSGLTNGTTYNVTVVATNSVGNSAPSNTLTGTPGDFVAPGAPTVNLTDPITPANHTAVTVSGTGEAGATANISVNDTNAATPAITGSTTVSGGGSYSTNLNLSSLSDGTITATVTLTDAANNTGPAGTDAATKNTTPAAPTVNLTDPITPANHTAVTVSGTGEANGTANISVNDTNAATPAVVGTTAVSAGGSYSTNLNLSSLSDGTITATVTITNSVNHTGPAGTDTATKNTTPAAPTVLISPDPINATNQTAVTISGTGAAGGTANITVNDTNAATPAITTSVPVNASGAYSATLDLTSLSDGTITASVTITNSVPKTGPAGTDTAVKNTAPPPADPVSGLLAQLLALINNLLKGIKL